MVINNMKVEQTFRILKFALMAALVFLAPAIFAWWKFGFTLDNIALPMHLDGDHLLYAVNTAEGVRQVLGGKQVFGAPDGQDLSFALVSVDWLAPQMAALLSFGGAPFLGMNLLLILGFPLTSCMAYFSLRFLNCRPSLAGLGGSLIALLPFHTLWSVGSITLSNYFLVPPSIALLIAIWSGALEKRLAGLSINSRRLSIFALVAFLLFVGAHYSYWALGLFMLGLLSLFLRLHSMSSPNGARLALSYSALIMIGFLLSAVDSLLATMRGGSTLTDRHPAAALLNTSSLTALFIPPDGSLSDRLLSNSQDYLVSKSLVREFFIERGFAGENFFGNSGLLVPLLVLVIAMVLIRNPGMSLVSENSAQFKIASFLTIPIFLLLTTGGLGSLVALFVSSSLRGYGRYSLFLGIVVVFLAVIWIEILPERQKWTRRIASSLVVFAIADSSFIPSPVDQSRSQMVTSYSVTGESESEVVTTKAIGRDLKEMMDRISPGNNSCQVLSLPIMHYPYEAPGYPHYRLLTPGLLDSRLSWSAGATIGSDSWAFLERVRTQIDDGKPLDSIQELDAFCAVVIDIQAWYSVSNFKPWPDYQSHPKVSLQNLLQTSQSMVWRLESTSYGRYLISERQSRD